MASQREQCSNGNNCSFGHDTNKRAKSTTPPASSPEPSTTHDVKNSAKAKTPRGRSPSGNTFRMPCKHHLKGTCANPSCEKWHSPECMFYKSTEGCTFREKCAFAHRRVEEQPSKRSERNGDTSAVALLTETKNLGCVFQTWSRQDRHRFYGRAQPCRNQSDVFDSPKQ